MPEFRKVKLTDIEKIAEYIPFSRSHFCDVSLGNIMFWRDYYGIEMCETQNALMLRYTANEGEIGYSFPLAKDENALSASLLFLADRHKESLSPLHFYNLCPSEVERLRDAFGDEAESFTVHDSDRDWHDYIYNAEDIKTLRGKRFSGQRNHINKFNKLYPDAEFVIINEQNTDVALDFFERYFTDFGKVTEVGEDEWKALREQLCHWESYRQVGGMLVLDGRAIAVSIGEVTQDMLIVHTEKADISFDGVYPKIVNCFANAFANDGVSIINREEDCGEAGLRQSKLSYHPTALLEKFSVTVELKKQ